MSRYTSVAPGIGGLDFEPARLALLLLSSAAFLLYVWNVARLWRARARAANLLAAGLLGVLGYVTAGQIKGAAYGVPVDALTYVGLASVCAVIVALVLLQLGGRKHEGA